MKRSQAQRDAQIKAMEAARGAAARRAQERADEARAEEARKAEFDNHVHRWSATEYAYVNDKAYEVAACMHPGCTQGFVRRVRL